MGRQRLYVLRKKPLKASALNEDKPKAPDEFSTATPSEGFSGEHTDAAAPSQALPPSLCLLD